MHTVSIFEAKTHLSRLVEALAEGRESEVVVSRHGKPVVRIAALRAADASRRIGVARGRFRVPADIDRANDAVVALFGARERRP